MLIKSFGTTKFMNCTSGIEYNNVKYDAGLGVNVYWLTTKHKIHHQDFNTTQSDCTQNIIDLLNNLLATDCKYIILLIDGNASWQFNATQLSTNIPIMNLKYIQQLNLNDSYYFIFDNMCKSLFVEEISASPLIKKYNITHNIKPIKNVFIICDKNIFYFFEDYIFSFCEKINAIPLIFNDVTSYNYVDNANITYIFCQSIPKQLIKKKFNKILLNTEQLTIPDKLTQMVDYVANGIPIMDYSLENIKILNYRHSIYVPYQYNNNEIDVLVGLRKTIPVKYDVVFCGSKSAKRDDIISKLREKNISVLELTNTFGAKRDNLIASCRILLNIHFNTDYNIYESLRCDRWIFAGMPVISEPSIYNNILDVNNLIKIVACDDMVDVVTRLCDSQEYNQFYENIRNKIQYIADSRKNILDKIFVKPEIDFLNYENKIKILIYGSRGWIGNQITDYLKKSELFEIIHATSHADNARDVEDEILEIKPDRILSLIGRTHGVGFTTIDYLEQPGKLIENITDNLYAPMVLAYLSQKYDIHYTYMGTGCIFYGYPESGYSENDVPDFFGSSYSVVKGVTDKLMHFCDSNTLNVRIRMPITNKPHPRNFITKIMSYEKICDMPNSMTVLPEMIPVLIDMVKNKKVGTINLTNPGLISHNEILTMVKEIIDPNFVWENFSADEQSKILMSGRSNNLLCTDKLIDWYPNISPIHKAVRKCLMEMRESIN